MQSKTRYFMMFSIKYFLDQLICTTGYSYMVSNRLYSPKSVVNSLSLLNRVMIMYP